MKAEEICILKSSEFHSEGKDIFNQLGYGTMLIGSIPGRRRRYGLIVIEAETSRLQS